MSNGVDIEWVEIRVPKTIVVDGKKYPRTQWNIDAVIMYESTHDKDKLLDRLNDFVLEFK